MRDRLLRPTRLVLGVARCLATLWVGCAAALLLGGVLSLAGFDVPEPALGYAAVTFAAAIFGWVEVARRHACGAGSCSA